MLLIFTLTLSSYSVVVGFPADKRRLKHADYRRFLISFCIFLRLCVKQKSVVGLVSCWFPANYNPQIIADSLSAFVFFFTPLRETANVYQHYSFLFSPLDLQQFIRKKMPNLS